MRKLFVALVAAASLGACSHLPEITNDSSITGAAPAPRERIRTAIELLARGAERDARSQLRAALEEQPNNVTAQRLLEQIETDPRALLGERSRPYVVRQGESMSGLAERFLGDGLMFYALARYNDLSAPDQLAAGQTLMIPTSRSASAAVTRPPDLRGMSQAPTPTAPSSNRATAPSANADRANRIRLQALQQLNTGDVSGAATLLRQARTLDPGNAAIERDLARAERLQASLASSGAASVR